MNSNAYTKNEILQELSSKGCFIDIYTLNTFMEKWRVEAIFEDDDGEEFFDKSVLDIILNNLFQKENNEEEIKEEIDEPRILKPIDPASINFDEEIKEVSPEVKKEPEPVSEPVAKVEIEQQNQIQQMPPIQEIPPIQQMPQQNQLNYNNMQMQYQNPQQMQPNYNMQMPQQNQFGYNNMQMQYQNPQQMQPNYNMQMQMPQQNQFNYNVQQQMPQGELDIETNNILRGISLSDGTPLISQVDDGSFGDVSKYEMLEREALSDITPSWRKHEIGPEKEEKKIGILEGALRNEGDKAAEVVEETPDEADFDDMSLLSESIDAQEKFKEYIMSEMSKKGGDMPQPQAVAPANNEFKLDISERTLGMIARSVAKKVAKHVSQMQVVDTQSNEKLAELEEKNKEIEGRNKKLQEKMRTLEDQNQKLRLLLAESNKNLNSYKPTIFGLYMKKK